MVMLEVLILEITEAFTLTVAVTDLETCVPSTPVQVRVKVVVVVRRWVS